MTHPDPHLTAERAAYLRGIEAAARELDDMPERIQTRRARNRILSLRERGAR